MSMYFEPQIRYPDEDSAQLEGIQKYLGAIQAHTEFRNPYNPFGLDFKLRTNVNVLVFSKVCNLSPWLEENLGGRVLYLVRHPVANAVSKNRNSWSQSAYEAYPRTGWEGLIDVYLKNKQFCESYLDDHIVANALEIRKNGSNLQRYVLNWCLDNVVPLLNFPKRNWHLVSYEDLVIQFERTAKNIFMHFDLAYIDGVERLANRPSGSTFLSGEETIEMIQRGEKENIVSNWNRYVSNRELSKCFEILDIFGLDFYQDQSEMTNLKYEAYKLPGRPDLARNPKE